MSDCPIVKGLLLGADVQRVAPPTRSTWFGAPLWTGGAVVFLLLVVFGQGPGPAGAATSTSVVSANILSATSLDASGCLSGAPNVTNFGSVPVSTSAVTSSDCDLVWGSSNDTSMLRTFQQDGSGRSMWRPPDSSLDTSFDGDGTAVTQFGSGSTPNDMVIQPDGKIVVVGQVFNGVDNDVAVARYNADGSLDTSFDGDGKIVTSLAPGGDDRAFGVVIRPDGKIDVAAHSSTWISLLRYLPDGSLDTGFDGDGILVTALNGRYGGGDIAMQPDGKVVIVDTRVVRFNPNGSLDTTFDGDGDRSTFPIAIVPVAVALQPDGKIVIAGDTGTQNASQDFAVMRLLIDGSVDTTFGGGGVTTNMSTGFDVANAMFVQPDGAVVVVGEGRDPVTNVSSGVIARYTSVGGLDSTFDGDGKQSTVVQSLGWATAALLSDGRIMVAGGGTNGSGVFARFRGDGSPDPDFNQSGFAAYSDPGQALGVTAIAVTTDGAWISAGYRWAGSNPYTFELIKFGTVTVPDYGAGNDWAAGNQMFGACLRSVTGSGLPGTWTSSATCPASNGPYWNPIPASGASAGSKIAAAVSGSTATASLRFGLHTASNQPAGAYLAPLVFEVLAPNV